jgi:pimeloyl-ACP methyl ester carboxylesterase
MSVRVQALATSDGAQVIGFLYSRGGEDTVVSIMHPRELVPTHYLVPDILAAGCACWVQGSRSPGNDLRLEHELALLDVAAGQSFLRDAGFNHSVLLGNSGGAALYAFYLQQSGRSAERRIAATPGGRPTGLSAASLPEVDGLILVSPHPGPGKLLSAGLDPAVTDEDDPLATNDALSAFSAANGYRAPPEPTTYDPSFLTRYREAQSRRVQRIDARARQILELRQSARRAAKAGGGRSERIRAAYSPIFHVWRTDADPRCIDLSIDPSDRQPGSLWGSDLIASNYGSIGFARSCTADSWLSSWSALSSNASFERCGADIGQPTLMIEYTGDSAVFPADSDLIFETLAASLKERHRVRGNHHGQPLSADEPPGQLEAGRLIQQWLRGRYPTSSQMK